MTRFTNYLTEEDFKGDEMAFIEAVREDCKPYLKLVKGRKLYRGINNTDNTGMLKKKVRDDRNPRDIPKEVHNYIDIELNKIFGWKPRSNGLFTTANRKDANIYGNLFVVFPIGTVKYIWSRETEDLFRWLDIHFDMFFTFHSFLKSGWRNVTDMEKRDFLSDISKKNGLIDSYTNKGIQDAIKLRYEIVFNCKEYYALSDKRKFAGDDVVLKGIYRK